MDASDPELTQSSSQGRTRKCVFPKVSGRPVWRGRDCMTMGLDRAARCSAVVTHRVEPLPMGATAPQQPFVAAKVGPGGSRTAQREWLWGGEGPHITTSMCIQVTAARRGSYYLQLYERDDRCDLSTIGRSKRYRSPQADGK